MFSQCLLDKCLNGMNLLVYSMYHNHIYGAYHFIICIHSDFPKRKVHEIIQTFVRTMGWLLMRVLLDFGGLTVSNDGIC
jgi:hypothetical protein